jgi:nicotinamidase-related amidase
MKKLLIAVDMQNDFVTGALGTAAAQAIVPAVDAKLDEARRHGCDIVFTRDTHGDDYLSTSEGRALPVPHCIKGTQGWEIIDALRVYTELPQAVIFDKPVFGSLKLAEFAAENGYTDVEMVGLCTDICVITNALLLKTFTPEASVTVIAAACAGVTSETHNAALAALKMCQVNVL